MLLKRSFEGSQAAKTHRKGHGGDSHVLCSQHYLGPADPLYRYPLAEPNPHVPTKEGRKIVAFKAGDASNIPGGKAALKVIEHELPYPSEAGIIVKDVSVERLGRQGPSSLASSLGGLNQ